MVYVTVGDHCDAEGIEARGSQENRFRQDLFGDVQDCLLDGQESDARHNLESALSESGITVGRLTEHVLRGYEPREGTHLRRELQTWVIEVLLDESYSARDEPAITHQNHYSAICDLVDLSMGHGPDAMGSAFARLANHAMSIEKERVLKPEACRLSLVASLSSRLRQRLQLQDSEHPRRPGRPAEPQTRGRRDEFRLASYPTKLGRHACR